jgi:hypothetical protein
MSSIVVSLSVSLLPLPPKPPYGISPLSSFSLMSSGISPPKGVMCAPFIGQVSIRKFLETGQIEQVLCDGENYDGSRPCRFDWVKLLRQECVDNNVTFVFCGTGQRFVKDGRLYKLECSIQSQQAHKSGMSFK